MTHDPQAGTLPAFPCPAAPYLPHDPPMALIDRVLAFGEDHIQASAVLGTDAGFDDGQSVPSWVLIEYMAQAIAAWAGVQAARRDEPIKIGFLVSTRRMQCQLDVFPLNHPLSIRAHRISIADNGLATFDCAIALNDEDIVNARINVFQPVDPEAFLAGAAA